MKVYCPLCGGETDTGYTCVKCGARVEPFNEQSTSAVKDAAP